MIILSNSLYLHKDDKSIHYYDKHMSIVYDRAQIMCS